MAFESEISSSTSNQRTLKKIVSIQGTGLFSGVKTTMTMRPAPEGVGIVFRRVDLPGQPQVAAHVENVVETPRCTILGKTIDHEGKRQTVRVGTVEHILSALRAFEIDNLWIDLDRIEVPSCDGSAIHFVDLIEKAGVERQSQLKTVHHLKSPVFWSKGDVHLVALPADELRVSYMLSYPGHSLLHSQFYSTYVNQEIYKQEIASARTFCLYEHVLPLIEEGRIKGGRLDNAVIVKEDAILNPEGLRYEDEMVRHKVVDLLGDLSLVGSQFTAHIIGIRSGHPSNIAFAHELTNSLAEGDAL